MKFISKVYATGRPAEYFANYADFVLGEDLPIGTLVAIKEDGTLEKADESKVPVGVVFVGNTIEMHDKTYLTGERDAIKVKKGTSVPLYKQFIVSGLDIKGTLKIGATVYLKGNADTVELTTEKPTKGFPVGVVERVTDKLVRFDLTFANALSIGQE